MARSLQELEANYLAQQKQASTLAEQMGSAGSAASAATGGALGLVGAIAAPIAARYIGDAFGLNERSAAEKQALARIQNVAEGDRTAAQAALEYQRARVGRQATQAAAMGPAREAAARQLVGQEQRIAGETEVSGRLAEVKAGEQARAQQLLADVETRAGEAERQRQRQMVAGAVTGGLTALTNAYTAYQNRQQRIKDLQAQAAAYGAAAQAIGASAPSQGMSGYQQAMEKITSPIQSTEPAAAQAVEPAAEQLKLQPTESMTPLTGMQQASTLNSPGIQSRPLFNPAAPFGNEQLQLKDPTAGIYRRRAARTRSM